MRECDPHDPVDGKFEQRRRRALEYNKDLLDHSVCDDSYQFRIVLEG